MHKQISNRYIELKKHHWTLHLHVFIKFRGGTGQCFQLSPKIGGGARALNTHALVLVH